VHRDIKPSNIMIHEHTIAKITDFGIAKIVSQHLTKAGTIMGTPSYMSPEQVEGKVVDGRADLYSLAVMAFEVLTGEKPFAAENLPTLLIKIVRDIAPPASSFNTSLPVKVDAIFRKALAKEPSQRYATCLEFIGDLTKALEGAPGWKPITPGVIQRAPTGSTESTADSEPPPRSHFLPPNYTGPPERPAPPKKSPVLRNVLLATATALGLAGAGTYLMYQQGMGPFAAASATPVADNKVGTDNKKEPETVVVPPPRSVPQPQPPKPLSKPPVDLIPAVNQPPAAPAESEFTLTVRPAGATAVFDDNAATRCTSPCTLTLPKGRHSVAIQLDGYRQALRTFNVPNEPGIIVELEKAVGSLTIASDPPGLTVVLDGKPQPNATPISVTLPVGPHKFELIQGTDRREYTVQIEDGVAKTQRVKW
jgi:serine/threonine-protein kinase